MARKGNPNPKPPTSRTGIPSKESFWLPPHDGKAVKEKSINPHVRWDIEQIIEHVFPKQYQTVYHHVASALVRELGNLKLMFSEQIGDFRQKNNFSKATLYNKVIPRLKHVGLLVRERDVSSNKMCLKLSKTFSNYISKIANEWESFVETSRQKQKSSESEDHI
jgi:hypothetical protein